MAVTSFSRLKKIWGLVGGYSSTWRTEEMEWLSAAVAGARQ